MAPGRGMNTKRVRNEIPTFSPVIPDYNSPIEKGLLGLQNYGRVFGSRPATVQQNINEDGENGNDREVGNESNEVHGSQPIQNSGEQSIESGQFPSAQIGKRGRGLTRGKGLMKAYIATGKKMKITMDPSIGRPADANESAKFSSQIGVLTRDVLSVPKKWKDVDKEKDLQPAFDHLNIHMDVNIDDPGVKDSVIQRLQNSSRQQRHRYHKCFQKHATLEDAKRNKPRTCGNQKEWEELCEYFSTEKFKKASRVNTENRKELKAPHITGRKAFTVRINEIQKEMNEHPCDTIELYKRTHHSEIKGWSTQKAEENWKLMKEKKDQYNQDGLEKTADEIVREVLGHGSGYIKGLGYGPKPPSTRKTDFATQQLEKELFETREKLRSSEAKVEELTTNMDSMQNKLSEQGANIEKLMAFMVAREANNGEA